jgi:hypothetical protein
MVRYTCRGRRSRPIRCRYGCQGQASRRMSGRQMDEGDAGLSEPVTERIIGRGFSVANALGHGFIEKVYENALAPRVAKVLARRRRAERRASPAMPERLASDRQAPLPADQLRPPQRRYPPHHPLLRVLSRPSRIARTIPFIPAIPLIRLKKRSWSCTPHCGADRYRNLARRLVVDPQAEFPMVDRARRWQLIPRTREACRVAARDSRSELWSRLDPALRCDRILANA